MTVLPFELKEAVLRAGCDVAPEWPALANDLRTVLRKASCLSRAWHDVSSVLLVETVHLRSLDSVVQLARRLSGPDGAELGARIRRIVVAPDTSVVYARETQAAIVAIIAAATAVREIHVAKSWLLVEPVPLQVAPTCRRVVFEGAGSSQLTSFLGYGAVPPRVEVQWLSRCVQAQLDAPDAIATFTSRASSTRPSTSPPSPASRSASATSLRTIGAAW